MYIVQLYIQYDMYVDCIHAYCLFTSLVATVFAHSSIVKQIPDNKLFKALYWLLLLNVLSFLGLRTDRWRRPIAMHSIIFPAFYLFYTQQIFGP